MDGIADLHVKFNRPSVHAILTHDGQTSLTVTGNLNAGTPFAGSDTVMVEGNGQ